MAETTFAAPSIHCEGCANSIRRSLGRLAGVQRVEVDVPVKTIAVQYDIGATGPDAIAARLDAAGYPVVPVDG